MEFLKNLSLTDFTFNWFEVIGSLTSSVLLSLLVVIVYMVTHKRKGYDQDFIQTLVFLSAVVSSVMLVIGHNLAGAFGLVGAVSIIRFRTRVENPIDTAYIFLVMAIGLSCGLRQYLIAIITTVFISVVLLAFWKYNFAKTIPQQNGNLLSVKIPDVIQGRKLLERTFSDDIESWDIVSIHAIDDKSAVINYRVSLKKNSTSHSFTEKLYNSVQGKMVVLRFEAA